MAIFNNLNQQFQAAGNTNNQVGDTVKQSGVMTPVTQITGITGETPEGRTNLHLAYNIDVYNDIKRYKAERHPMLSAMFTRAKPADMTRYVVSESFEDSEYFDNLFDTLRKRQATLTGGTTWKGRTGYLQKASGSAVLNPVAINNSNFIGGELRFTPVAAGATTADFLINAYTARTGGANVTGTASTPMLGTAGAMDVAVVSLTKFGTKKVAAIGFGTPSTGIIGSVTQKIDKDVSMFLGAGYEATKTITEASTATEIWNGWEFIPGTSSKVNMLFDNLGIAITYDLGTDVIDNIQKSAVKIGIHQFWINATWDKFIMVLDLDDTNIDVDWNTATGTNDGNYLLMKQVANAVTVNALTVTGYTYIHPVFQVGAAYGEAIDGIPEGSGKVTGGNFKRTFRNKVNYTQIFRIPSWVITGTRMAEKKARFIDDWQDTRETNLFLYKDRMTQAFLFNRASEQSIYNTATLKYENVRTTSGVWDRELNDYKVVRLSLTNYLTNFTSAQASNYLMQFVNEVGRSVTAFTEMKTKPTVTVGCSMDMIVALGELENAGKTNGPNSFGKLSQGEISGNTAYLGIPTLSYETPRVKLVFVWEPSLDYATKFPLPYYMAGTISPRKIMMALSIKDIGIRTLRPDKIQAGIQSPGDDKYEEDMIGEHGVEIFNSRKNTIFIVD